MLNKTIEIYCDEEDFQLFEKNFEDNGEQGDIMIFTAEVDKGQLRLMRFAHGVEVI